MGAHQIHLLLLRAAKRSTAQRHRQLLGCATSQEHIRALDRLLPTPYHLFAAASVGHQRPGAWEAPE